jgi:uncharacterized protein
MNTLEGGLLNELSREECFELLASQPVGRVAIALPHAAPLVVPVNFTMEGEVIVFRSGLGTKLDEVRKGQVSFQVDWIDWVHRSGWSVLAHGEAYEASHWETHHLDLGSWVGGDKSHWVRLKVGHISGRRLEPAELAWSSDSRGYL